MGKGREQGFRALNNNYSEEELRAMEIIVSAWEARGTQNGFFRIEVPSRNFVIDFITTAEPENNNNRFVELNEDNVQEQNNNQVNNNQNAIVQEGQPDNVVRFYDLDVTRLINLLNEMQVEVRNTNNVLRVVVNYVVPKASNAVDLFDRCAEQVFGLLNQIGLEKYVNQIRNSSTYGSLVVVDSTTNASLVGLHGISAGYNYLRNDLQNSRYHLHEASICFSKTLEASKEIIVGFKKLKSVLQLAKNLEAGVTKFALALVFEKVANEIVPNNNNQQNIDPNSRRDNVQNNNQNTNSRCNIL